MPTRLLRGLLMIAFATLAALGLPAPETSAPVLAHDTTRGSGVFGPTMVVDPAFDYYRSKPLASIAAKIRNAGFTAAQITDTGGLTAGQHKELADTFRAAGVSPVLRVYPPTDSRLYRAHPEWHQKMLGGADGKFDWRTYLCPSRPEVVKAYADKVAQSIKVGNYDGVQFAEIWFEQWGGPEEKPGKPRAHYACVCDACLAKFRTITGRDIDAREMLTCTTSPLYFRKSANAALYKQWVDMRVDTVQEFAKALVAAARAAKPGIIINNMFLSDARQKLNGSREYQAVDVDRIVRDLHPDIITVQDAWQDWTQADLKPSFIKDYARSYCDRIRKLQPGIYIMSHADIGSLPASRRSAEWIRKFADETVRSGLSAPSYYEWSVSRLSTGR